MKKPAILIAMAAVLLTSCDKRYPDNPGRDDIWELTFNDAEEFFCGDYYQSGTDNYVVHLGYAGKQGGVEEGMILQLDLNAPVNPGGMGVAAGTYKPLEAGMKDNSYTFVLGAVDGAGYISGSYAETWSGKDTSFLRATDGTVTVSYNGSVCRIEVKLVLDGYLFVGHYVGVPSVTDLTVTELTVANAEYYGDFYGTGTSDLYLYMLTSEYKDGTTVFPDTGVELALEFICNGGATSIVPGVYEFSDDPTVKPYHFIMGYYDEMNVIWPSYLYVQYNAGGEFFMSPIVGGTVEVAVDGKGVYDIEAEVVSEDEMTYKFIYSGQIPVTDLSAPVKSGSGRGLGAPGRTKPDDSMKLSIRKKRIY